MHLSVKDTAPAIIFAALFFVGVKFILVDPHRNPLKAVSTQRARIESLFQLTTQSGARLSPQELADKPFAIFFGFTHCPEICPTTLWEMSREMRQLGQLSEEFKVLFVSLDPARDTPEILNTYLKSFDSRIIGLTGNKEEVEAAARAFHIYWEKVPTTGDDYVLNHTAIVFLMSKDGVLKDVLSYQEDAGVQIAKLKKLLASASHV